MSNNASDSSSADFEVISTREIYRCPRFHLEVLEERGLDGKIRERQVIRHPGAAVILPILPDGRVVLIEQHRTTLGRPQIEAPAGGLEPGEDPLEGAKRELAEETGYRAGQWKFIQRFYPAPGITDECMDLYIASELEEGEPSPDEDEWVEIKTYDDARIKQMLESGEITDAKTLIALYVWLNNSQNKSCLEGKS